MSTFHCSWCCCNGGWTGNISYFFCKEQLQLALFFFYQPTMIIHLNGKLIGRHHSIISNCFVVFKLNLLYMKNLHFFLGKWRSNFYKEVHIILIFCVNMYVRVCSAVLLLNVANFSECSLNKFLIYVYLQRPCKLPFWSHFTFSSLTLSYGQRRTG